MKTSKLLIIFLLSYFISLQAQASIVKLNVEIAGTLTHLVGNDVNVITNLTLTGKLNGSDIKLIREMPNLSVLDIEGVDIVKGGDNYYEGLSTEDGVVPAKMFYNHPKLTSVILPNTAAVMEGSVFYNCFELLDVSIGDNLSGVGNYAFYSCEKLKNVKWGKKIEKIDNYAFYGCISLTDIVIPHGVESIGTSAFANCAGLKEVVIPENVFKIYGSAFENCIGLEEIVIPNNVVTVNSSVFKGCVQLKRALIGDGVSTMGMDLFQGCTRLMEVTIGNEIKSVPMGTFEDCSALENVKIGNNVCAIDEFAFTNCFNLKDITVSDENKFLSTIDGALYNKDKTTLILYPNKISSVFTIPDGVVRTEKFAFRCPDLKCLIIPESLTEFPDSEDSYVFFNCENLTEIHCKNLISPRATKETFFGVNRDCKAIVPEGSLSQYENSEGWKKLMIVERGGTSIESITQNEILVHSISNGIQIKTTKSTPVSIYNISGQKVYQSVIDGDHSVNLHIGFYIVETDKKSIKVVVK